MTSTEIRRILIVAPHCDDEVLGCGGIMAKYARQGHHVHTVVLTNGHLGAPELFPKAGTERVRAEVRKADQALGAETVDFLDFPGPRLDSVPIYQIALKLSELVRAYQITDVYLPHRGDIHKDHLIAYQAGLVAARPLPGATVRRVYAYETLSETEWAAPFGDDAFIPTHFVDISDTLADKIKAFQVFETQQKAFPHPRSPEVIEHLARLRGSTVGMQAAEAFMIVRTMEA
ncbi:MAG: PIG-L family deacetylase [Bacteroidetes bacterium]|nr:PIG-L family deacetylase [Bacteroidota bacterium]